MIEMWKKIFSLFLISFMIMPILTVRADRCILPISDVDVYGPGQKAIIAWNGTTERLILSTDLYSNRETLVLEILPLPSEPMIEKGDFKSFQKIQNLMVKNFPQDIFLGRESEKSLQIIFRERIGAHDITIVEARSADELYDFISEYIKYQKIKSPNESIINEKTKEVLRDYLSRGYNFWVFDLVNLYSEVKSIDPIIYEFKTPSLYYPMKVSTTAKGNTEIILYLITEETISEESIPSKMKLAQYFESDQIVQFQLSYDELDSIDNGISELFDIELLIHPSLPVAWLTAVKYEGELSELDIDLEIPPRPIHCRSIEVWTDKTQYDLGEAVAMTIDFTHLLPGCFEIETLHYHEIHLEIYDYNDQLVRSWQWSVGDDFRKTIKWRPPETSEYTLVASSWCNDMLEVEDQYFITVSDSIPPIPNIMQINSNIQWLLYGVIITISCILIGVGLTYLLLRRHK
ncbi:MAG: DUF2330 domain-containing protein [Candidatus Bathyarchaeota archaeon]|nr:DUF2330 domain-containing protein [Candidatus Bathyarchaeota archaeon]